MAEVAPAPAAAAPAKAPKKKSTKPKKTGPSVGELIVKAVSASKERGGVSLAALKKALAAGGYDVDKNKARVKIAVKKLVTKGTLLQTKGTGASGSFKLNKKIKCVQDTENISCQFHLYPVVPITLGTLIKYEAKKKNDVNHLFRDVKHWLGSN
uniref:Histone H1 n=1 Tax=Myripristis murdjan TaxID=586833 RepID=A0A667YST8_9TELE